MAAETREDTPPSLSYLEQFRLRSVVPILAGQQTQQPDPSQERSDEHSSSDQGESLSTTIEACGRDRIAEDGLRAEVEDVDISPSPHALDSTLPKSPPRSPHDNGQPSAEPQGGQPPPTSRPIPAPRTRHDSDRIPDAAPVSDKKEKGKSCVLQRPDEHGGERSRSFDGNYSNNYTCKNNSDGRQTELPYSDHDAHHGTSQRRLQRMRSIFDEDILPLARAGDDVVTSEGVAGATYIGTFNRTQKQEQRRQGQQRQIRRPDHRTRCEDGRPLSAQESSDLFWQESDSLDAKSSGITNDCPVRLRNGSTRQVKNAGGSQAEGGSSGWGRAAGTTPAARALCRDKAASDGESTMNTRQRIGGGRGPMPRERGRAGGGSIGEEIDSRLGKDDHRDIASCTTVLRSVSVGAVNRRLGVVNVSSSRERTSVDDTEAPSRRPWTEGPGATDGIARNLVKSTRARTQCAAVVDRGRPASSRLLSILPPELKLGHALGASAKGDGAKISAVGKHITSIEGVAPEVSSRATHLFLSNNSLRCLDGLEAYTGVTSLSLAHNLVRRTEDLGPLAFLPRLETLSLEGNEVCGGAANYRAHVISLASPRLRTLDRRQITSSEISDSHAITTAERSSTRRIARVHYRCMLAEHMSGLLECHAELRKGLLTRVADGSGDSIGNDRAQLRDGGRYSANQGGHQSQALGANVSWRQYSAMATPMHHFLTLLCLEEWPLFGETEMEVLQRRALEDVAERFAEVIADRRAAGKRTYELSEGAVATLDSPCTRSWGSAMEEIQRRAEVREAELLARCENTCKREAEHFRNVSVHERTFLHGLASRVGSSDETWAIPPCARALTGRRRQRQQPTRAVPDEKGRLTAVSVAAPLPSNKPIAKLLAPATTSTPRTVTVSKAHTAARSDAKLAETVEEGRGEKSFLACSNSSSSSSRVASTAAVPVYTSSRCAATAPLSPPPAPAPQNKQQHLPVTNVAIPGDYGLRDRLNVAKAEPSAPTITMASAARFLLARVKQEDKVEGQDCADVAASIPSLDPALAASGLRSLSPSRVCFADDAPILRKDERMGMPISRFSASSSYQHERSTHSWPDGGREDVDPSGTSRDRRQESSKGATEWRGGSSRGDRESEHAGVRRDEGKAERRQGPTIREALEHGENESYGPSSPSFDDVESPPRVARGRGLHCSRSPPPVFLSREQGNGNDAGEDVVRSKHDGVAQGDETDPVHAVASRGEEGNAYVGTANGLVKDAVDGTGGSTINGSANGRRRSSDATRRLLREAQRVQRLLETMDKADASGADDGLRHEDPLHVINALGLIDVKPLTAKLAHMLDRTPEALMGGGFSDGVPDARSTRGLRDQVAGLGQEVARRAVACAEARKLHSSLRRQVEVARRARARNLDAVDVACRRLVAKAGEELQVLQESRRVAQEAERYHATLARLQEQVQVTDAVTRRIMSGSEAVAVRLRDQMDERGGQLSSRRGIAEQGLEDWDQAALNDAALRASRRAYDCEVIVLRHRMRGGANGSRPGANRSSLATAFYRLRTRTEQQRRVREWLAAATIRRDARLAHAALNALARGSRLRAAAAAAAAARCRVSLAVWRQAASLSKSIRVFRWRFDWTTVARGFRRWHERVERLVGSGEDGALRRTGCSAEREHLEWKLNVFRERRAKRVVFQAWWGAVQVRGSRILGEGGQIGETQGTLPRRRLARRQRLRHGRRESLDDHRENNDLVARPEWGARLRSAEALVKRRRIEIRARSAFQWWRRQRQCNIMGRTAGIRRALRVWMRRAGEMRSARIATAETRGRYVIALGRRVLAAWSSAAATRARRRAGTAAMVAAVSSILTRGAYRRWVSQAASATVEISNNITAFEHSYDRCLRGHLRAWSGLVKERRILRRGVDLLLHGRRVAVAAAGLRQWQRGTAEARNAALRQCRIKAWTSFAARRRRLELLSVSFTAWFSICHRVVAIRRLTRRAASAKRRLGLARGFRAMSLLARRQATNIAVDVSSLSRSHDRQFIGIDGTDSPNGSDKDGVVVHARPEKHAVVVNQEEVVTSAMHTNATLEGKLGQLRARLAQARALALEKRAGVSQLTEEIIRSEQERAQYSDRLRRQVRDNMIADHESGGVPQLSSSTRGSSGNHQKRKRAASAGKTRPRPQWKSDSKEGVKEGEDATGDGPLVKMSLLPGTGIRELTEKEKDLFERLQEETLEILRRAATTEKDEEEMRAAAARKAAGLEARLREAVAEGKQLKAAAEQRQTLRARLELEAQHAATQAATLSDRLAGAEQDLGFDAARNAERIGSLNQSNARMRAAATTAEERLASALDALRRKDRELEELRLRAAREGARGVLNVHGASGGNGRSRVVGTVVGHSAGRGRGSRARSRGRGRERRANARGGRDAAYDAAGLEFQVLAVAADAQSVAKQCAVIAGDRRAAAGSALTEALHAATSNTAGVIEADDNATAAVLTAQIANSERPDGDDTRGEMAKARQLVEESVDSERRAVARLTLRGAEAKMRQSADLTLRASVERHPLESVKSLSRHGDTQKPYRGEKHIADAFVILEGTGNVSAEFARDATRKVDDCSGTGIIGSRAEQNGGERRTVDDGDKNNHNNRVSGEALTISDAGSTARRRVVQAIPSSPLSMGSGKGDRLEDVQDCDNHNQRSTLHVMKVGKDGEATHVGSTAVKQAASADGMLELKQSIVDLESKILGRLGGGGGDGGDGAEVLSGEDASSGGVEGGNDSDCTTTGGNSGAEEALLLSGKAASTRRKAKRVEKDVKSIGNSDRTSDDIDPRAQNIVGARLQLPMSSARSAARAAAREVPSSRPPDARGGAIGADNTRRSSDDLVGRKHSREADQRSQKPSLPSHNTSSVGGRGKARSRLATSSPAPRSPEEVARTDRRAPRATRRMKGPAQTEVARGRRGTLGARKQVRQPSSSLQAKAQPQLQTQPYAQVVRPIAKTGIRALDDHRRRSVLASPLSTTSSSLELLRPVTTVIGRPDTVSARMVERDREGEEQVELGVWGLSSVSDYLQRGGYGATSSGEASGSLHIGGDSEH